MEKPGDVSDDGQVVAVPLSWSARYDELREAVRAMQTAHARLGTGDDVPEEEAFQVFYVEAVMRVLALELPVDADDAGPPGAG